MKVFLIAAFCAIVLGTAAAYVLDVSVQTPAYKAFTTAGARLDEPGNNLVGADWPAAATDEEPI